MRPLPIDRRDRRVKRADPRHFVIDLHGERVAAAAQILDRELHAAFMQGCTGGLVICGHGTGALLRAIGAELAQHPMVLSHERASGGAPSYAVQIIERTGREELLP